MARPASPMKQTRTHHSQAYKDEALALADFSDKPYRVFRYSISWYLSS